MKKVLSFVLILALVLGSFSFAFGLTDIKDSANSEAITVANDLGIVNGFPDGTFKPDQAVNRAEFAAMITRALAIPESALAAYTSTSFKDTAGYGWAVPYLAFCESKGIMLGDGMGNAMPGRTISVNEAITMAARAIGYTANSANLVGSWPANYVTLGQTLGLYDDVAGTMAVSRESAAQVIYNSLRVPLVTVNADGATNQIMDNTVNPAIAKTLLTAGLGCTASDKTVINGTEGSLINLMPYLGAYAVKYLNSDNDIVAIGTVDSTFLTGTFSGGTFTANDVDYTGSSSSAAVNTTAGGLVFLNGLEDSGTTNLNAVSNYVEKDTVTLSVKLNGKKITDLYSALIWDTKNGGAEGLFEAGDLDEESLMNFDFTLDDDDKIDPTTFVLVGVNSLDKISVDNVVTVYADSKSKITKVEVGTDTVTGTVERINADGDVMIGGTTYSVAYNKESFPANVGEEGTLYLDVNGDGFSWDVTDATSDNYAMVVGESAKPGRDQTVVLFDKAGVEKEYVIESDATGTTLPAILDKLVVFGLTSAGKIEEMNTVATTTTSITAGLSDSRAIFAGRVVDTGVVVFVENGVADYEVGALGNIETGTLPTGAAKYYADTTTGKVKVIVIKSLYAGGSDMSYGVLNEIQDASVDGDTVNYLLGFADGKALTAYTDNKLIAKAKVGTNANELVAFKINSDGVVTAITTGAGINSMAKATASGLLMARTDNSVQLGTTGSAFVAIDPNAVVYVYDDSKDAGKQYSVGSIASLKVVSGAGMTYLYQMDSDSEKFDFVIYKKN